MGALKKITISLPGEMVAEIRAAVDELRRWVTEGRDSGEPVDGEAVLNRLRAKYASMASEEGR